MDSTITDYLHDGDHEIVELDPGSGSGAGSSGDVLRRYVHGPGTDRPIAMVEGDAVSGYSHSYYHADRLGSVVALTDDSGAPVAHYAYSEYGVPYLVDPGTGAQTQVAAGQPFLFTGRRFDFETGLYYYRARYYSAPLGRFLQTDPVGYEDQMNLYAYVGNDPVNAQDPTGEFGFIGGLIGAVIEAAIILVEDKKVSTGEVLARIGTGFAVGFISGGVGRLAGRTAVGIGTQIITRTGARSALRSAAPKMLQGAATGTVSGAASGATYSTGIQATEGNVFEHGFDLSKVDGGKVLIDAAKGAGIGALAGAVAGGFEARGAARIYGDPRGKPMFGPAPGAKVGAAAGVAITALGGLADALSNKSTIDCAKGGVATEKSDC